MLSNENNLYISVFAFVCLLISYFLLVENKNSEKLSSVTWWDNFEAEVKKIKPIPRFIGSVFFALFFGLLFYIFLVDIFFRGTNVFSFACFLISYFLLVENKDSEKLLSSVWENFKAKLKKFK